MSTSVDAQARDAIFRIASMTKPITSVVAMMLVEEGKLRLDEPIDRLAPELADRRVLKRMDGPLDDTVPARRQITLEDVFSFRLGWGLGLGVQVTASPYGVQPGAYGWDGGFGTSWFNDPAKELSAVLLTQRVFDSPNPPAVHKTLWRDAYAAAA